MRADSTSAAAFYLKSASISAIEEYRKGYGIIAAFLFIFVKNIKIAPHSCQVLLAPMRMPFLGPSGRIMRDHRQAQWGTPPKMLPLRKNISKIYNALSFLYAGVAQW